MYFRKLITTLFIVALCTIPTANAQRLGRNGTLNDVQTFTKRNKPLTTDGFRTQRGGLMQYIERNDLTDREIDDLIESIYNWSRLGYDIPDFDGITISYTGGAAAWSKGFIYYKREVYSILADSVVASSYIYFNPDLSETALQDSTSRPAIPIGGNTWVVAYFDSTTGSIYRADSMRILHAAMIQAGSITAVEIAAGTIQTSQLNFVPLHSSGDTTQVLATINASAEGIDITADRIAISGLTTFASLYDPTEKSTTVYSATEPTSPAFLVAGNLWVETDNNNRVYTYTGAAWVLTETVIDGGRITTGTIDASQATITNIDAANISTGTLTGRTVQTAAADQRIFLSQAENTMRFYDALGANILTIDDDAGGYITLTDGTYFTKIYVGGINVVGSSAIGVIIGQQVNDGAAILDLYGI